MSRHDAPSANEPRSQEKTTDLIEAGDDWTAKPSPRDWLIPGWLPAGRVAMLTGPGKVGKSRLALQLAAALAAGRKEWLPGGGPDGPKLALEPNTGKVAVLATWEDERDEVARRLHGMKLQEAVGDRLRYVAPRQALWIHSDPLSGTGGALSPEGTKLREYCATRRARLLIVDPRAAAYGLNENDRALVRAFVSDWDRWAQENHCAVLLLAHPPKAEGPYSGTTDWHAAVRAVWELTTRTVDTGDNNKNRKTAANPKAYRLACLDTNYGPLPRPLWLKGDKKWEVARAEEAAEHLARVRGDDRTATTRTTKSKSEPVNA